MRSLLHTAILNFLFNIFFSNLLIDIVQIAAKPAWHCKAIATQF